MDKILKITLLYDFYGELLTERQKQMFEMYYLSDLSLSEIGEQLEISRQAVRDSIKHSRETLQQYEDKLCLVYKFSEEKSYIVKIQQIIDEIQQTNDLSIESAKKMENIKQIVNEIIDI